MKNSDGVAAQMFKIGLVIIVLFVVISPLAADDNDSKKDDPTEFSLDFGRFRIANTPKLLEDGLQNDFLFGYFYTDARKIAGDIKVRYINGSEDNVKLWDIDDSMLSRTRQVCEVFFLPFNYYFFRNEGFTLHVGAGVYYDYNKLNENGYFNDSVFYDPPGDASYNAYTNDFTAHALGPLVDIGASFNAVLFSSVPLSVAVSFGSVPWYYLNRQQSWKLSPMMNPEPSHSVSSESWYGPYFYGSVDLKIDFKYVSLFSSFLAEFSRLRYTAAGFNEDGSWADVEEESENKVFALEISLLLHLGKSDILPQIGYGRKFDEATGGGNYFMLGARKEWF